MSSAGHGSKLCSSSVVGMGMAEKHEQDESEENVDEEYCPGLEPFFFDEAEAVAGHERWMPREQERAQKEEQRVRAANANISAREKILDDDPKQDGRYFNRFYLADFSTFDIDEEPPLPPMRYTARVCDNNKRWKIGGVNILSVNIASLDVDFPIDVYGTVIARDGVDYKCIYLFRREKEHCQLIKSEDESLILTGPKRGLELLGDAFIEIDLKINDHLGQEEKQLSKGLLTIRGIAGRNMDKCIVESKDLSTRLSTVKVMYAIVNDAVEATIAIEVIEGEFYGKITAITTGVPNHLVLHDSEVAGAMNGNGKGVIQLLRSVVSVSLEGCLLLTFVDQTGNLKSLGLTPGLNGRVEAGTTVGLTKMLVKVVWSVISI